MKNQSLWVLFFAINALLFLFIAAGYHGFQSFDKITVKEVASETTVLAFCSLMIPLSQAFICFPGKTVEN
jgi:hypothetical protein